MDITIDYTTGAGPAALYLRQRNFAGKYANFTTLEWDTAESADSKMFFAEPDPVNAPGFYAVAVTPIAGGGWPMEVVEAATGLILYKGETEAAAVVAPTLNEIRAAIIDDHGPGLYGPGVAAEYAVRVTAVVAGSDPAVPIPDIPQTIPMVKALVYLHSKGKLEQVVAAINGMGTIAQIRFQREVNCNRYDELVLGIQQLLGWTDAEMDAMFTEADSASLT